MKTWLLLKVLSIFAGISDEQWKKALEFVRALWTADSSGELKRSATLLQLKELWPEFRSWALGMLIEAAVAFVNKEKKVLPKAVVL